MCRAGGASRSAPRATANGSKVQLWDYFSGTNQKFYLGPTTSGYYRIQPDSLERGGFLSGRERRFDG